MALTKAERDQILAEIKSLEERLYPDDETKEPKAREALRLQDRVDELLAEYADRLPRVLLGACPFTGDPLERSFDPHGLDGPWWWKDRPFDVDEPAAPDAFQVLLGALALGGRKPVETTDEVIPGPEVPFVVPSLLALPEMVAVVARVGVDTGDIAYPISYWSMAKLDPADLHQPWLRQDLWFKGADGEPGWLISNAPWDFDLAPYVASGKLRWLRPGDPSGQVVGKDSGETCPYLNLPGDREPQSLGGGDRELLELPNGAPITPFEE